MDEYKRRRRRSLAVMSMFLDSLGGIIDDVDVATFDGDGSDLKSLIVGIEPVQSGTGEPSPDNIRPITGHSSVNVIVSPTLNPLDGTITNIPFGRTVYGGTLDVLTGLLTVKWVILDLGTRNWTYIAPSGSIPYGTFYNTIHDKAYGQLNLLCSAYPVKAGFSNDMAIQGNINASTVYIVDSSYNGDTVAFTAAMSGVQLCYELISPTTVQLTGQQISTFLGTNNVWCDSGKIIYLEY